MQYRLTGSMSLLFAGHGHTVAVHNSFQLGLTLEPCLSAPARQREPNAILDDRAGNDTRYPITEINSRPRSSFHPPGPRWPPAFVPLRGARAQGASEGARSQKLSNPTSGNPVPRSQQPRHATGQGPHTRALSINVPLTPASPPPHPPPASHVPCPPYAHLLKHLLTVDQRGPLRARTKHVVLTCTYIVGHRPHA
jgi:hypothetical protein